MTEETPNMAGRLGLVLYWLGCIVAAVGALIAVSALVLHEPDPDGDVARSKAKANTPACIEANARAVESKLDEPIGDRGYTLEEFFKYSEVSEARDKCRELNPEPYPWEIAGIAAGVAVAAWLAGRALRFILKGD